jgi:GNAT superfamily N-acetyltransferase
VSSPRAKIIVRSVRPEDFSQITELTRKVYPESMPWKEPQLASQHEVFPDGQLAAVESDTQHLVGLALSLIIRWDDYNLTDSWLDFTNYGMFTNHDPVSGRTLYGAEVMVDPAAQRRGVGSKLYQARRELVERLGLRRIRAAARLRGYHRHAKRLSAEQYVVQVIRGELKDPTLSFQIKHGFEVIAVVPGYLKNDPASLGYAAVIEWLNPKVAKPEDSAGRDPRFQR